jgi:hypothetical protein
VNEQFSELSISCRLHILFHVLSQPLNLQYSYLQASMLTSHIEEKLIDISNKRTRSHEKARAQSQISEFMSMINDVSIHTNDVRNTKRTPAGHTGYRIAYPNYSIHDAFSVHRVSKEISFRHTLMSPASRSTRGIEQKGSFFTRHFINRRFLQRNHV